MNTFLVRLSFFILLFRSISAAILLGSTLPVLQCQVDISATQNHFSDPECSLLTSDWSSPGVPGSWVALHVFDQGCCAPDPLNLNPGVDDLTLFQRIATPQELKEHQVIVDLKIFYLTAGYPSTNPPMQLKLKYLDESLQLIEETSFDFLPLYSFAENVFEAQALAPPCSIVEATLIATGNGTACFEYFFVDFHDTYSALGEPKKVFSAYFILFIVASVQALLIPALLTVRSTHGEKMPCKIRGLSGPNLLEHQKSRGVVTLIFASTIQWFFTLAYSLAFGEGVVALNLTGAEKQLAKVFVHICIFLYVAALYLPLFLCYENRHRLLGLVCGIISTLTLFSLRFVTTFSTYIQPGQLVIYLPEYVILAYILLFFSYRLYLLLFLHFTWNQGKTTPNPGAPRNGKDVTYVKRLLAQKPVKRAASPPSKNDTENASCEMVSLAFIKSVFVGLRDFFRDMGSQEQREQFFRAHIWDFDPCFRFPQRLLSSLVMLVIICYDISAYWGVEGFKVSSSLACSLSEGQREERATAAADLWVVLNRNLVGVCVFTLAFFFLQLYFFLKVFKGDLTAVHAGRFTKVHALRSVSMNNALRFMGYQVGYGIVGSVVNLVFGTLIFFFLVAFVNSPEVRAFIWEYVFQYVLLAPMVFVIVFSILQAEVTKLFLADGSDFYVTHRRSFQFYDYAFIFINLVRGLLSFTTRISLGFFTIVISCYRLDKPLLTEGFHWMDDGYQSYLGLLGLARHYNNPIATVFIHHLNSLTLSLRDDGVVVPSRAPTEEDALLPSALGVEREEGDPTSLKQRKEDEPLARVRRRFLVAITLSRNPALIPLRKRNL